MSWILYRTEKKCKTKKREISTNTIEVEFKKHMLTVCNQNLIDYFLMKAINKSLDKMIMEILEYLSAGDDDEEQTGMYLDMLAKERGVLRAYDEKLSEKAILSYMTKIRFAAHELRKRAMACTYEQQEPSKGRGR